MHFSQYSDILLTNWLWINYFVNKMINWWIRRLSDKETNCFVEPWTFPYKETKSSVCSHSEKTEGVSFSATLRTSQQKGLYDTFVMFKTWICMTGGIFNAFVSLKPVSHHSLHPSHYYVKKKVFKTTTIIWSGPWCGLEVWKPPYLLDRRIDNFLFC